MDFKNLDEKQSWYLLIRLARQCQEGSQEVRDQLIAAMEQYFDIFAPDPEFEIVIGDNKRTTDKPAAYMSAEHYKLNCPFGHNLKPLSIKGLGEHEAWNAICATFPYAAQGTKAIRNGLLNALKQYFANIEPPNAGFKKMIPYAYCKTSLLRMYQKTQIS